MSKFDMTLYCSTQEKEEKYKTVIFDEKHLITNQQEFAEAVKKLTVGCRFKADYTEAEKAKYEYRAKAFWQQAKELEKEAEEINKQAEANFDEEKEKELKTQAEEKKREAEKARGRVTEYRQKSPYYRSKENFDCSDCFMIEFDNDHSDDQNEWITIDRVKDTFKNVGFYYCNSKSNMKEKTTDKNGKKIIKSPRPKFHCYFPRKEVNREEAELFLNEFKENFKSLHFDEQIDISKMFGEQKNNSQCYFVNGDLTIDEFITEDLIRGIKEKEGSIVFPETFLQDEVAKAPFVIEDIIRENDKLMMISAPSKAGKSFLALDLAVSIATGRKWLGKNVKQGKVVFFDTEMDTADDIGTEKEKQMINYGRVQTICKKRKLTDEEVKSVRENLIIRPIKTNLGVDGFVNEVLSRYDSKSNISAIIIDPIYTLGIKNENDNSEVVSFLEKVTEISVALRCPVLFIHHFAKGNPADKREEDCYSGAGAFFRYIAVQLILMQLDTEGDGAEEFKKKYGEIDALGFELKCKPRQDKAFAMRLLKINGIFEIDTDGVLDKAVIKGTRKQNGSNEKKKAETKKKLKDIYLECGKGSSVERTAFRKRIDEEGLSSAFQRYKNELFKIEIIGKGKGKECFFNLIGS